MQGNGIYCSVAGRSPLIAYSINLQTNYLVFELQITYQRSISTPLLKNVGSNSTA